MVAYHYPPESSSSGVQRTLKFSCHLPSFGWTPHVLTLRESIYPVKDDTLKQHIPAAVTVHRTAGWDSTRHFAVRGRHLEWTAVPDPYISWLPFAVARGLKVIKDRDVRVIFSTSPKPTAHLIAATLKWRTRLPWVADFRDPWIDEGVHPRPGTLRLRVESRCERYVMQCADGLTVTTPEMRDHYLRRYPQLPAAKVRVIFNGFDEADFEGIEPDRVPLRFEILHAGLVTPEYRDPVPLLHAVARLLSAGDLARHDVRLTFLGCGTYVESETFARIVRDLDLGGVVDVQRRIPHRETLRRLHEAAVLLVLQAADTQTQIPAKLFEYLRVGRPVLALAVEGATPRLLRELGAGVVVVPGAVDQIAHAVRALYQEWKTNHDRRTSVPGIAGFSRLAQTSGLARVLDETAAATMHAATHGVLRNA